MAQYVLINPVGTRHAGEVLDSVQDGQAVINQLAAFGGVLVPLPNSLLQPYIDRCQQLVLVGNYDEATAMMQAAYASSTAISGGGTTGTIPIWSSASGLANSAIVEVSGAIQTLTLTNAGAGATNGSYTQQTLTGGSGSGATADIVVAGNVVTLLALRNPGTGYTVGNTLSCATIGGAGFVFTVSAVSATDNASGNVTALRVGAGTAQPLSTLYASGLVYSGKAEVFENYAQPASPFIIAANIAANSIAEASGKYQVPAAISIAAGLSSTPRFDTSLRSSSSNVYALYTFPVLVNGNLAGTSSITSVRAFGTIETTDAAKTFSIFGVNSAVSVTSVGAGCNISSQYGVYSQTSWGATTPLSATLVSQYDTAAFIQGAAHTIATHYGLRLRSITLNNGSTIASAWGVSQEYSAARSAFYGNLGVGNALDVGAGKVIGSLTLTNGGTGYTSAAYSQVALTTVTGTGSGATADIVVTGGIVTTVVLRAPGQGYAVGDTLSCASIGAGSNFLLTVATTASILRSDGTVLGTRVGAGTTAPIAGVDSRSAMAVLGTSPFIVNNPSFPSNPLNVQAAAYIGTTADPSGRCTPPLGTTIALGYFGNPIFDMSSQTAFCQATGAFFKSSLEIAGNGSSTRVQGVTTDARVFGSTISGKTLSIFAFSAQANIAADLSNANTFSLITSYTASQNISSTTAQTITAIASFNDTSSFFTGGAHVVTNHYAFRSVAPTLGAATITNRWGISLEDSLANNVLAGKTAMGQAAGTAATAQADLGASTTAAASLRIRTGVAPTTPNDGDIWFDGTALRIRIAGVTRTVTVT